MSRLKFVSCFRSWLISFVMFGPAWASERDTPMPYPLLPEAISSFGATVCDGSLYVFGGHAGRLPGNSVDGLSPYFCRIPLDNSQLEWESLPMHATSQSPGLVTWDGKIYRVGGLRFKNRAGDPTVFQSLDTFAVFDPKAKTWTDLPSLPQPRSSLDAAVVDGKLYVVGGWNLQEAGSQNATWHDTVLMFDLTQANGAWTTIAKPPFSTRALAAAGHHHKLYVMGGMNSDNKTTRAVHIYDPATDSWSEGPQLAGGDSLSGFAISAYESEGKLYYSGSEGIVYQLSEDGAAWRAIERLLFPRSFHRLVAYRQRVIVVAGVARGGGYLGNLEVVDVSAARPSVKSVEWSVKLGGEVKQGQALLLHGAALYAFGGNRTREPHNFSQEAFVNEAYRFDLAAQTVERLDNLPQPVQGGVAYLAGSRIDQSIYLFGGLGYDGEKYRSLDTIFQYRLRSKGWMEEVRHLPTTRAMFHVAGHQGDVWFVGGSRVNTEDKGLVGETWRWAPGGDDPVAIEADAAIPTSRRSYGGAVLNGRFYAIGGLGEKEIVETAEVFDLADRKWTTIKAPGVARVFPNLAAAGGKLYLAGGFARVDGHFQPAHTIEEYDPQSNDWKTVFQAPPFNNQMAHMLEFQDRLLFFGIDEKQDGVAHLAILDPTPSATSFGKEPRGSADDPGPSVDRLARLMRLDKNKDGKLTADEVGERFRPIIVRADADKDGFATKEELESVLRQNDEPEGRRPRN